MWTIVFIVWRPIISHYWESWPVKPPISLPSAIAAESNQFEYCQLPEDPSDFDKVAAGTPVPSQEVIIATPAPMEEVLTSPTVSPTDSYVPTKAVSEVLAIEPTTAPTSEPSALLTKIDVVNVGKFEKKNWHFVFVGVGYDQGENLVQMQKVTTDLEKTFDGIDVDFAYVKEPLNLAFTHVNTLIKPENRFEIIALFNKIRVIHPIDSLIIGVNTTDYVGTAAIGLDYGYAILTLNDPSATLIAAHELGHQLGLSDGYRAYYPNGMIPNSELFYLDSMPKNLARALGELGKTPPMYLVGTCNGKPVYQFYESSNNVYGDYSPTGPNSWSDSIFTPLQILEMNNYIRSEK